MGKQCLVSKVVICGAFGLVCLWMGPRGGGGGGGRLIFKTHVIPFKVAAMSLKLE